MTCMALPMEDVLHFLPNFSCESWMNAWFSSFYKIYILPKVFCRITQHFVTQHHLEQSFSFFNKIGKLSPLVTSRNASTFPTNQQQPVYGILRRIAFCQMLKRFQPNRNNREPPNDPLCKKHGPFMQKITYLGPSRKFVLRLSECK